MTVIGRCIDSGISDPPFVMALDETFLDLASSEDGSSPILHFYRKTPSISLGYFRSVEKEVNVDACRKREVGIYRRTSGGGTIFENKDQLIYGLILPDPQSHGVPSVTLKSFRYLNQAVILALEDLGFTAEYVPVNDILINGRKVSGCAQTRRKGSLLQHGTLIQRYDSSLMFKLLKVAHEKIANKGITNPADRVTSLEMESSSANIPVPELELIRSRLAFRFSQLLGVVFKASSITGEERKQAEDLATSRYRSDAWNFRR